MPPEQYITLSFFRKYTAIDFEHTTDLSHDNEKRSEVLLANNFLVLDQTQFNLISLKYVKLQLLFPPLLSTTAIFYKTWLEDYYKYCKVPSTHQRFIHKIQIYWRTFSYSILNKILRIIDGKNQRVSRFVGFCIKRVMRKG